jgi:hypothetical protein
MPDFTGVQILNPALVRIASLLKGMRDAEAPHFRSLITSKTSLFTISFKDCGTPTS